MITENILFLTQETNNQRLIEIKRNYFHIATILSYQNRNVYNFIKKFFKYNLKILNFKKFVNNVV